ncbi:MAG: hypothetical protein SO132_01425 [Candidatus Enteromonas sp.]|nr:hypothetical protein [Mollicutes bacterium]MDY4935419.1 hypothetical protein [Candidatus Enteromonas sp.]
MNFEVSNTYVYGLERAVKASGNPMRVKIDTSEANEKDFLRASRLGSTNSGEGHDNFLKGITVQLDVAAPLYWWKEAQRYHWFDFISSQSTMHCLLKFDVSSQCVDDTDPKILERMKELVEEYNQIQDDGEHKDEKKAKWRVLVASLPCGFCLCATMTTNYQQLKTMYRQRCNHKLKEWHVFCDWILSLPHFKELTGLGE